MASDIKWRPQADGCDTRKQAKGLVALRMESRVGCCDLLPNGEKPERMPILRAKAEDHEKVQHRTMK